MANRLDVDLFVNGIFGAKEFNPPAACIPSSAISGVLAAEKLEHQFPIKITDNAGTAVLASTQDFHIVNGSTGTIVGIDAMIPVIPTGADRVISVDFQKSTGGGTFTSILTSTLQFSTASTARQVVSATIAQDGVVAGDILRRIVSVAGAAGNQAQGMLTTIWLQEQPV